MNVRNCSNPECELQITYVRSVPDVLCPRCKWAWKTPTEERAPQAPVNWDDVPWTPFMQGELPTSNMPIMQRDREDLIGVAINSRYQVNLYDAGSGQPFGRVIWLSIKTLDKSARHDWRDLQRIKNEVVGEQYDAVEIYPAEEKLVDTSNQYHLWVFLEYKMPFGFHERAVGEGNWNGSVQRPFPAGWRPADCMTTDDYHRRVQGANVRMALLKQAKEGGKL